MALIGSRCFQAKLTWQQAREIIEIRAGFVGKRLSPEHPASVINLARVYNVSMATISKVAHHKSSYTTEIAYHVNGTTGVRKKSGPTYSDRNTRADVG